MGYFPNEDDKYFDEIYIKYTKRICSVFAQDLVIGDEIREIEYNEIKYSKIANIRVEGEYIKLEFVNSNKSRNLTAYQTIECVRDR